MLEATGDSSSVNMRQKIDDYCEMLDETILYIDGFDDAIIGIGNKFNYTSIVYSKRKIIEILCKDMDEDGACEYFEYNIAGSYVGDNTPFIMDDYF